MRSLGFPIIQEAPIVTMRLVEIKGRKTSDILADPQHKIPEWELEREYRSTYREQLSETEKITDGHWIGRVDYHPGDVVPISLDEEIAKDFGAKIGDELVFDVQGVPIKTKIASLREVDWKRFQTNFFVVFPGGRSGKRARLSRARQSRGDAGRLCAVAERGRREIPECLRDRFVLRHPNRRRNPEQSRARHSHHVALHRWRRD